ncbi:RNA polymerase sigma factor [Zhouia amylolytica]|uniref:ECF subfamily RNA polymerase sigma-24 subunit n=1 Tax=Zhouia amylolytica AD3 TaxID=1286632 RepID=W2US14_9FLAO|nr:sigma-70 family RNA polymerase sigma factor [Zhouia amylolytica]ETN96778.1 ECF subfamily RNA polymerase sigma-24 subunit [Zhouia amylolytica AD3]
MPQINNSVCEEHNFNRLFRTYSKSIRNFIFYKCGNENEANDITQEAFIKLWTNCKNVPFEKAKSFLYTVANNAFLNTVAHQKVVLKYAEKQPKNKASNETPQFILEEQEYMMKLQTAIANLTEAQRTAFLLNRIDGKKYKEIAEMLNISVKAVEKRISGALICLRKEIENI